MVDTTGKAVHTRHMTTTKGLALTATALLGIPAIALAAPANAGAEANTPPRPVVTSVTGTAADGFTVRRSDKSVISTPTDSEAKAECSEYPTRTAQRECLASVATEYRMWAEMRDALRYADGRW